MRWWHVRDKINWFFPYTFVRIGGNNFHGAESPPWNFPFQNMSLQSNISSPPTSQSSAVENYPSLNPHSHKKGKWGPGGIACIVGGGTLVASCAALVIAIQIHRARAQEDKLLDRPNSSFHSISLRTVGGELLLKFQGYASEVQIFFNVLKSLLCMDEFLKIPNYYLFPPDNELLHDRREPTNLALYLTTNC